MSPITAEQVTLHRGAIQAHIATARHSCALAAMGATEPAAGRTVVHHATKLSNLLLDEWQLSLVEEMVDHDAGCHEPDCTSLLCEIDADELVEMSERWMSTWPTLAAWLSERAALQ